ncbi:MAG TPA: MFS transporter [Polyangiaceae bacterium]|nr:MFS transporter [Polyangiaceae bacterium]
MIPSTSVEFPAALGGTRRLSKSLSFLLLASMEVSFLAGSIAPTPVYALYQAAWGYTPITTTLVFAVYALAVLASLLIAGSVSDHVGRRPVLLAALAFQGLAMLLFATAGGVNALLIARVVQGLSTGAALGALGAGMLDIDRARGTIANSVAPMLGTATGGFVSGLMVQFLPSPTHLVYLALLAVFALQGVGVLSMPEMSTPAPGALASLRPQLRLPVSLRRAVWLAAPLLIASWALAGFYGSLGPALVRTLVGAKSPLLGGLAILAFAGSGALTVLLLRAQAARGLTILGASSLAAGVALTLAALSLGSVVFFFLGTGLAGAGFGAGFQGAIRSVVPLASSQERAGVLSVLFLISYLAMGVPAVAAGARVVYGRGLSNTAWEYGITVIALALLALLAPFALAARRPQ